MSRGMSGDRLREVEEHLNLLREQRRDLERQIIWAIGLQRTLLRQVLQHDINPQIRKYEEERYWLILAEQSEQIEIEIADPAPDIVVAEIVEHADQLQASQQYSDEVLEWLRKIYAEVSQEKTAEAKLRGVLSLLPPFVNLSYEAELDTENFLQQYFPKFRRWSKALAKKSEF